MLTMKGMHIMWHCPTSSPHTLQVILSMARF
jgi:hypothetical protein